MNSIRRPGQIIFSYTRLDSFKQCPRQYAYRYIEKPDIEKKPSIEMHLGKVCHETIQQIYKDLMLSKQMSLQETLDLYDELWERLKTFSLRIVRERYNEDHYRETGRKYVESFYKSNEPFQDGRTLGIEKQVAIHVNGIRLTGYIDRLVDCGKGHYEIVDYKTNKELPSLDELENNWQLPLYHVGLKQMFSDVETVTCTWYFLAHNKRISLQKTEEDLHQLKSAIVELTQSINRTEEFEPRPSALCSWCDYEVICPARKHLVMVDQLPTVDMRKETGVNLVDAYVEAKRTVTHEEAKIKELEKKIFEYAQKQNVIFIRGTEDKLRVWSKKGAVRLVSKEENPKAAEAVMTILRKHHLLDRYVFLSGFGVAKSINNQELPKEVVEELKPYLKKEDVWRLYLSKVKN